MSICNVEEEPIPEDHKMAQPQIPMEMISQKRRPAWDRDVIQDVEKYGALEGSKRSRTYYSYVSLMCNLVDAKPTCFEEVTNKKELMDAMLE